MYVYAHKVACLLVFQTFGSSDALSLGLSSLTVKLHQIGLSSFLLCLQTIAAYNPIFYSSLVKWKVYQHSSRYCFLPATPNSLRPKRKFPSSSYVRMSPETRCIVLALNIATDFITRWSNAKFRTSGHCASWISRDDVVMLLCPFFRMARSVYPPVRSLKPVLACSKGNVDYFLDWLKWSTFENGVVWISIYASTEFLLQGDQTSGHCASWISRDDDVMRLCPCFGVARSVYPLVRSLKPVLACPKWNVDYFHDWLKWSSFENGVVWISVYASTEFGFMYHLKKVIYYMTYDAYLPFLGILSLEVGFIFSSHVLILADYNLLSFPDILVNILFEEVSFFALFKYPQK